jgi:Skp family chaperone for outer membrane proteins
MANPNYPNYPGGGQPQQGGYPQQQQYPQQPQGGGYPQQGAPAQQPAPEPPKPKPPSGPSPLGPPAGPAKMLYIGLLIMIFSFAVKQILVDLSVNSAGNMLEKDKIQAQMAVEMNEIDTALDSIDTDIETLKADAPKPPEGDKDREAFEEKMKKQGEKLEKLQKDRADKDKDLEDKRKEVRKKYIPLIRDAGRSEQSAHASTLSKLQITLLLKLIMDLFKIVGGALCILSGLGIAADPEQSTGMKAYAAVIAGIAFLGLVAGGILALLS